MHTVEEYYSLIRRSDLLIQAASWIHLKGIMLNEKRKISLEGLHIPYDSIYKTFLRWLNSSDGEQINGC